MADSGPQLRDSAFDRKPTRAARLILLSVRFAGTSERMTALAPWFGALIPWFTGGDAFRRTALIRTVASTHKLLEQLYAGEVGPALVSATQLGLPVVVARLQVGSLAPRLVTRKPDKNDVKKRATSSRALHFLA